MTFKQALYSLGSIIILGFIAAFITIYLEQKDSKPGCVKVTYWTCEGPKKGSWDKWDAATRKNFKVLKFTHNQ